MTARDDIHRLFESGRTSYRLDEYLDAHRAEVRAEAAADVHRADLPTFPADETPENVAKVVRAVDVRLAERGPEAPYGVAADTAADFFRPGRTYAYDASGFTAPELLTVLRVVATTTHPDTGKRTAFGWIRGEGDKTWTPYAEPADEWPTRWTDITGTETAE